jgi:probable HAF family extracellular repeat protein
MNSKSAKFFIRKHRLLALVGPLLLFFVAPQQSAAQTAYTVTDVGPVNDLNDTVAGAAGINNHGLVVGQASLPAGTDRAFLWMRGSIFDLRTLGGPESDSHAINENGEVAGAADTAGGTVHAFLWQAGAMTDLLTLSGGDSSEANGINARGEVVGFSATGTPDPTFTTGPNESHAFLSNGGPMQDLHILGGPNSIAIAVNSRGLIVGWSQVDFRIGNFGFPDLHAATWINGVPAPLGDFGGSVSLAIAVNDEGGAVGQASLAGDPTFHAVMWQNGTLTDLLTVPGDAASMANDINNKGEVVGISFTSTFTPRAFVWQGGVMTDLNTLIPSGSGWCLLSATGVNDMGQIVGNGFLNGSLHAFLLTPSSGGGKTGSIGAPATLPLTGSQLQSLLLGEGQSAEAQVGL